MPLVVTPWQIQESADALNADFLRVAQDVEDSAADASFRSAWGAFADSWWGTYADLSDSYAARLWGGTQELIDDYRTQLGKWRANLAGLGGRVTGPDIAPPIPSLPLPDLKWLALAAVAVLVVLVVARR